VIRYAAALLAVSALSAAPALAARPADGLFVAPKGKVELGYDLKFKVSNGGTKISRLVANVLENCDGESTSRVTTVGPKLSWKVRNGKFSGRQKETYDGLTVYTTLEGSFKTARKAVGIVRQETIVAGSVCDTYELDFTALLKR
jgi:hypothetical protein